MKSLLGRHPAIPVLLAALAAPLGFPMPAEAAPPAAAADSAGASTGWRASLRKRLTTDKVRSRYGLRLGKSPADGRPLVVLIHGFNSTPESTGELIRPVREAGLPCATFAYPNDQPLRESAALLSVELKRLAERQPGRRVALVSHSMGGLVARACVEDARLDPGNVNRLIMVAPPTRGSVLAEIAVASDLWEHWIDRRSGGVWSRTRDAIVDGMGEAARDLRPGSPFLRELNARERNPRVSYTLILGTDALVADAHAEWIRRRLAGALERIRADETAARVHRLIAQLDEVVVGKGDGVVSLERARLEGVDDVVVLPFGHLRVVSSAADPPSERARALVLDRLLSGAKTDAPRDAS